MNKNDIVIVVPIYKDQINITEQISLEQLYKVLKDYSIVFVAPHKLKKFCHEHCYNTVFFEDRFFSSTSAYSELLLSDCFYASFVDYKYMLIYQLDAFVFRDELLEFCNLDYDYIGAPLPRSNVDWKKINARVGNGGLSLRKISSVRKVLGDLPQICDEMGYHGSFYKYEDLFFGFCGANPNIDFSVPDIKTALRFSVDENVCHIYQHLSKDDLPFGCHGWSRGAMYPVWRTFITDDNIFLSKMDSFFKNKKGFSYRYIQWERVAIYIISRYMRYQSAKLREIFYRFIANDEKYYIWGYGQHGVELHKLLNFFEIGIVQLLDINHKINYVDDIPLVVPDMNALRNSKEHIIIAAIEHDISIKQTLLSGGVESGRVILYREILEKIVIDYVTDLLARMR